MSSNKVDKDNVDLLDSLADDWWNPEGRLKGLHPFNHVRVPFVARGLNKTGRIQSESLEGIKLLDVGCGTGIFSEALAKAGANVTGIDPGKNLIRAAEKHKLETLQTHPNMKVNYICDFIENHSKEFENYYDVVVTSEVIEHVPDPDFFMEHCIKCLKPGGSIFVTTFNRTFNSWFFGQVWGEWILNMVPRWSHSWFQFRTPEEVEGYMNKYNCHKADITGFFYVFFFKPQTFWFIKNTSIMFGMHGVKNIDY
jgi:polyprenyldihydroxybenzoate methyltransferase / 3-demethylubiquinol 3-O-methyltransferase